MPQVFASYAVNALFQLAVTYVVNRVATSMQKKPTRVLQKVDVSYQGALEPRRRLYGRFRAAGLDTMPAMTTVINGPNGIVEHHLHRLLTLSDGEIQSIDAVWFLNDRIDSSSWDATTGNVTSGPYMNFARVRPHLGLASQTPDSWAAQAPHADAYCRRDGAMLLVPPK